MAKSNLVVTVESFTDAQLNELRAVLRSLAVLTPEQAKVRDACKEVQAARRLAKDAKAGAELLKKLL